MAEDKDRKITGTLDMWITSSWVTPKDILKRAEDGEPSEVFNSLTFSNADLDGISGFSKVGTAHVTAEFYSDEVILECMADGLRKEIQKTKAEAQKKVEGLEERLNQLLALPNPDQLSKPRITDEERLDDEIPF